MYEILEEYLDIFKTGKFVSKIEKKQRHNKLVNWYKKEYKRVPNYREVEQFMKDNDDINFSRQFYFKVVFPVVDYEVYENGNLQDALHILKEYFYGNNGEDLTVNKQLLHIISEKYHENEIT